MIWNWPELKHEINHFLKFHSDHQQAGNRQIWPTLTPQTPLLTLQTLNNLPIVAVVLGWFEFAFRVFRVFRD